MPDFSQTLPAIDQNLVDVWTEQNQDLYAKLPYYLVKGETDSRKRWQTWTPLLTETMPWTPNLADTVKMVMVEDSPVLRQEARPNLLAQDPLEDIYNVQERYATAQLRWQDFSSPHYRFLPSFQDFMKGNLIPARKNIEKQIKIFEDMVYRSYIWDSSPTVYVAGYGPVPVNTGASSKTSGVWSDLLSKLPAAGYLSFEEVFKALTVFEEEIGATPYEGSGQPGGESMPLNERFCLVTSPEAWNQFVNDPWLKENRPLNMNIVTEQFKGDLWGKVRCKLERFPFRVEQVADPSVSQSSITIHAPEVTETNPNASDFNRTKPNPNYAKIDVSEIEVGWFVGGMHYKRIESGPPPEFFAGATSDPAKINGMQWNGQVTATRNFFIPGKDSAGNAVWKANDRGRFIKFIGELTTGIIGYNQQNIMPIIYRRRRGTTTTQAVS